MVKESCLSHLLASHRIHKVEAGLSDSTLLFAFIVDWPHSQRVFSNRSRILNKSSMFMKDPYKPLYISLLLGPKPIFFGFFAFIGPKSLRNLGKL